MKGETPRPITVVTRYRVSCMPSDHEEAHLFTLVVECRRGEAGEQWAVTHNGACFDIEGNKSWGFRWPEEGPEREAVTDDEVADYHRVREAWLRRHRFTEAGALGLARRLAPRMSHRGITVLDALENMAPLLPQSPLERMRAAEADRTALEGR